MPWKEVSHMELRGQFIEDWLTGEWNVSELCRHYGISRKTGYKAIERFRQHGKAGLSDLSRRPHSHPATTSPEIIEDIVQARKDRPHEGVVTLLERLRRVRPDVPWPAPSTAHEILRRSGLIHETKNKRRATPSAPGSLTDPQVPNHVLSIDFKGQFKLGNGTYCHPLTVTDNYSRYLLRCTALGADQTRYEHVRAVLEACFEEYGLPDMIRSDNGPPFATTGLGGLSKLSVWWIRLGIRPERIEPGKPQQNGRHERMHRTLKRHVCKPAAHDLRAQQQALDRFRSDYNERRPHQGIKLHTPSELYSPSPRRMPLWLPEIEYPAHMLQRKVKTVGQIKLDGREIQIGQALAGERVGLRFEDDDCHVTVFFCQRALGTIDLRQENRRFVSNCEPPRRT